MERRTFLSFIIATPAAIALAACGSDADGQPVGTDPALPPVTDPSPPTTVDPEPAEQRASLDAIVEFGYYGGFTTRNVAFQMQPSIMITSDGRLIQPADTTLEYPGPLIAPMTDRSITPEGVDAVLSAARDAGLLADVDYETNENIADASTATLVLNVGGESYLHQANALGVGGPPGGATTESSPERQALADFAASLSDITTLVGADAVGPEAPYVPTGYQLTAFPVANLSGYEIEPTVVEWPADTGVVLADVDGCAAVDAAAVADVFSGATELTFFAEDGITYEIVARSALPGRTC